MRLGEAACDFASHVTLVDRQPRVIQFTMSAFAVAINCLKALNRQASPSDYKRRRGAPMNKRTEAMPTIVRSASPSMWRPRLFRATYVVACAVAMFGWTVGLSWAGFSILRFVVSQFT
jgi:hypothetical protein